MVRVNWFPGHMHKARKEIENVMKRVQVVVEVVDARTPFSSENPLVSSLRGPDTPCLKVLNKCDLADPEMTERWVKYFETEQDMATITLEATRKDECKRVVQKAERLILQSSRKTSNILVVGIPNVGKSTLINGLAGRNVCKTGDVPAVTRAQQLIQLTPSLNLLDTPGFLWPKLEPEICAHRLAISGAIKDVAFDFEDIGIAAIKFLQRLYPNVLVDHFGCPSELVLGPEGQRGGPAKQVLEHIAVIRGCLKKGGMPNLEQASKLLVTDFRKGRLGRLTLETPEMIEEEGGVAGKEEGVRGAAARRERQDEKRRLRRIERNRKRKLLRNITAA